MHLPSRLNANVNVGNAERWVSAAVGGAVVIAGVRARSLPGLLLAAAGGAMIYRGVSGHCPGYTAAGINNAESEPAEPHEYFKNGIHVEESVSVARTPWDLYQFWRDFDNLPRFLSHVESVKVIDNTRSHWTVNGPAGQSVEWDAEIINDEPNALIAWRSLANANVDNAGSVRFVPSPDGQETIVRVVLDYIPPAGFVGKWVAQLFGKDPATQIREDLKKLKRVMETEGALNAPPTS
jgi:uncharacterized membrane protein